MIKDELKEKVIFQPCTTTIIRKIIPGLPEKISSKNVAVNIAFDRYQSRFGDNMDAILTQIAKALKIIQMNGYNIFCVAHCGGDLNFCKWLNKSNVPHTVIDGTLWLPEMCFAFYNEMEIVLGMRGHSQMIPFGLNGDIITLGSQNKQKWFLEDIGFLDCYIDPRQDIDNLALQILEKFSAIQSTPKNQRKERLIAAQEKLYQLTTDNFKNINVGQGQKP